MSYGMTLWSILSTPILKREKMYPVHTNERVDWLRPPHYVMAAVTLNNCPAPNNAHIVLIFAHTDIHNMSPVAALRNVFWCGDIYLEKILPKIQLNFLTVARTYVFFSRSD